MAVMGGCKIFTRNGGGPKNVEVGFIMGGWEIFEVSLHSWQKGSNPPNLWSPSPILPTPLFSNFVQSPPPTYLLPPNPTPNIFSVVLFLWLNGWSHHIWCAFLLNDNMNLHILSLGTLVPKGPWCMLCNKASSLLRSDTCGFYSTPIWYHKHTNTHNTLRGHWQTHINIYLHHLLCAQNNYLYYIKWLN